jgi:drug/metabolite transporter (DMT)-like permease
MTPFDRPAFLSARQLFTRATDALGRLPPTAQGFAWVLLSGVLFALLNATLRYVSLQLHPMMTSFLRFCFGLLVIAPIVLRHGFTVFHTARPSMQILRNLVHASAFGVWYTALPLIPLAEMTAISSSGPLFITIGAFLFLREQVRWRRWLAVLFGFAGVWLIVRPGFAEVSHGTALMLIAVPIIATSQLIAKVQTRSDSPNTIICWQTLLLILFFFPAALYFWEWPSWRELGLLAVAGVLGTSANMCLVNAYKVAEISVLQPLTFLNLVWASIMGLIVFGDTPDHWTFIGAGVIVASTTYIARREAMARREAQAA